MHCRAVNDLLFAETAFPHRLSPRLENRLTSNRGLFRGARQAELERKLEAPAPSAVRFHPKLAELYRSRVTELSEALEDETIRAPALDLLRSLIDRVVVHHEAGTKGITLEVEGALSAMIAQAQPGGLGGVDPSSLKLVAGVGFEPTTFRL